MTLQQFNYQGTTVRTVLVNGEPGFIANDLCAILSLGNPRTSLALLDADEKGVHNVDTLGGLQQMTYRQASAADLTGAVFAVSSTSDDLNAFLTRHGSVAS